jgi:uncharacterized protein
MDRNPTDIYSKYTYGLCIFAFMFIFRVIAQLLQKFFALPFLPVFDAWQSGALPYHWLFVVQIIIILVMIFTILKFINKKLIPARSLGKTLLLIGIIYLIVMIFRLIAGLTFASDHPWLGATIPAFFHIVLASFILLTGHFHYRFGHK